MRMDQRTDGFMPASASADQMAAVEKRFIGRVFRWMTLGLGLSGIIAFAVATSPEAQQLIFGNRLVMYGLLGLELVMVFSFSAVARRASAPVVGALFLSYAAVNGLTLSVIFMVYTASSIANVFFVSTGAFGAMSLFGAVTKRDLTSVGSFCMMGLFGVIIASIVNMFVHSGPMGFIISCAGVVVFVGLTAYDTQKLKALAHEGASEDAESKLAMYGALILYLDFVNLFLQLLRLFGKKR